MLDQFIQYIKTNNLFKPKDRILLAVSGGMDSVVMAELFHRAEFNFAIAHCNFQLRGKESDGDEKFVRKLANKYHVKFYCRRFNTEQFAFRKKLSIQVAARELRYDWFNEIIRKEKHTSVATAHHLNDSIETFFINLIRGTGIEGMTGIKVKHGQVIRPLLCAQRKDIETFAKKNKISFREDSSNYSDDYLRNRIRHHLIPAFRKLTPQFEQIMSDNLFRFSFAATIVNRYIKKKEHELLNHHGKFPSIKIADIKEEENPAQLLFNMLTGLGFSFKQCEDMLDEESSINSGKIFLNEHYRVLKDRGNLLLNINGEEGKSELLIPHEAKTLTTDVGKLKISRALSKGKFRLPPSGNIQCMDNALLKFPLNLRAWRPGDYFFPLGMKHRKKLSDFFIDQKVNLYEKEKICVLTSDDKIVCILGHRIDDRFKVTEKTKKIYKVEMQYY